MDVEFIDVEKITGRTILADDTISLDVEDKVGKQRCLNFKAVTHDDLLATLLSSSPIAKKRVFSLQGVEPLPSGSRNRRILFRLNLKTAICIEVQPSQIAALKAVLGDVADSPGRAQ